MILFVHKHGYQRASTWKTSMSGPQDMASGQLHSPAEAWRFELQKAQVVPERLSPVGTHRRKLAPTNTTCTFAQLHSCTVCTFSSQTRFEKFTYLPKTEPKPHPHALPTSPASAGIGSETCWSCLLMRQYTVAGQSLDSFSRRLCL